MLMNSLNPVAFKLFGLEVRWYAICILIGVIIAVIMGVKEGKKLGIFSDYVYTGICIVLPLAIVGARLWYVLFNLDEFDSLLDVLGITSNGLAGLAIQGGVIASLITIYFYAKKRNVSLYSTLDIVAPGFLIGQICGRWGNFFNGELYGPAVKNVDLLYRLLPDFIMDNMKINGVYYHPTFLYESLLNLVGLIIILIIRRKSKKLLNGDLMGFYLIWYGFVRIFTETLRSMSGANEILKFGPIPVSIAISVLFIICGIVFLIVKRFVGPKNGYLDTIANIKANHINTIVFDLDGTLIDSRELIIKSFDYVFNKYFPDLIISDEQMESFFGPPLDVTFSQFETKDVSKDELIKAYREYNAIHHDELVRAFPGVKDVLAHLYKNGYNLAVVSAKKQDVVMHGLKFLGLDKYISVVLGQEDVKQAKPNPEGINKALEHFNNVNKAMYVGDHPNDILAGKNANIKTCGVLYSSKSEELTNMHPDYLIGKFTDIYKIVIE